MTPPRPGRRSPAEHLLISPQGAVAGKVPRAWRLRGRCAHPGAFWLVAVRHPGENENESVALCAVKLELLRSQFSDQRLEPYVDAAAHDPDLAVALYDWNIRLSAACLEDLSIVEVLLRNAFDRALSAAYGAAWYDGDLRSLHGRLVDNAKEQIRARFGYDPGREPTRNQVVAELPFGFWKALLGRDYQATYWPKLRPVFRHLPPPTRRVHQDVLEGWVGDLVDLRNVVAHHWPVIDWTWERSIQNMKSVTGPISPAVQIWMVDRSRLPAVLAEDPRGQ